VATTSTSAGILFGSSSTGNSTTLPATDGSVYSAAVYMRCSKDQVIRFSIEWKDSAGTTLAGTVNSANTSVAANTWTKFELLNKTAVASSVFARITVYSSTGGIPWQVDDWVEAQAATWAEGAELPEPFHGSQANTGTKTYAWTGTADASTSTLTISESAGVTVELIRDI